jgi:arsenite methyltransferase
MNHKNLNFGLKIQGLFSISDVVIVGDMPANLLSVAELYAGCISGAIQQSAYVNFIQSAGFTDITTQKERPIVIPNDILKQYVSEQEIEVFKKAN